MGDNYRRARAWPEIEGECEACKRWIRVKVLNLDGDSILNRHRCVGEQMTGKRKATEVHVPKGGME